MLLKEQDFYDLMYAYLQRASIDNVYVAEIFFDPQTHTERGIPFDDVVNGLHRALCDGLRDFGIRASLVLCFLRHLSEDAAMATLQEAKRHRDKIVAVGLDSGEVGNPPSKFERVFAAAAGLGLRLVAHAGEEAGPSYIEEALDQLRVSRVDHGVRCLEDPALVQRLIREAVPLTVCPLSNEVLKVNQRFFGGQSPFRQLLDARLSVTVNSDDPAYFGGYITANFLRVAKDARLSIKDVHTICTNAFVAAFLSVPERDHYLRELEHFSVAVGALAPPRSVSMFGSRRPLPGSEEYETARAAARLFAERGFKVVSGGYYGIMEAVSRGAKESGPKGVAQGILAPRVFCERTPTGNEYVTHAVFARNLSDRIHRILRESEYFFVFGGTIGTVTELMVVWNAASLRGLYGGPPQKIYLLRSAWEKAIGGLAAATGIFASDTPLLTFVDSASEALELIEKDLEQRTGTAEI